MNKAKHKSKLKADQGFCVFGSAILARRLDALRLEIAGVRQAQDIEFVHRMRVASRRLRSALPLFQGCLPAKHSKGWIKEIRRITRALGAARDTDVQIEALNQYFAALDDPKLQPGIRRLLLRLRQERESLQVQVLQALDRLQGSAVLEALEEQLEPLLAPQDQVYLYTPYLYTQAYQGIAARLEEFGAFAPFVEQPECIAELHAMRIAAKRLRYTLEVFAPLYPGGLKTALQTVRKIQEGLGDIHDSDVWVAFLPEFLEKERTFTQAYQGHLRGFSRLVPGIQAFQENRAQKRAGDYGRFVAYWRKVKAQETWQNLQETIQIPFHQGDQVVPGQGEQPGPEKEAPI